MWWYAFHDGFLLFDRAWSDPAPVAWSRVKQVRGVMERRGITYEPGEPPPPTLVAYALELTDGTVREVARDLTNVEDPAGRLRTRLPALPRMAGVPQFPTVDDVIAAHVPDP